MSLPIGALVVCLVKMFGEPKVLSVRYLVWTALAFACAFGVRFLALNEKFDSVVCFSSPRVDFVCAGPVSADGSIGDDLRPSSSSLPDGLFVPLF